MGIRCPILEKRTHWVVDGVRRMGVCMTCAEHMKKDADGSVRRRLGMRKCGSAFVWAESPSEMHYPREPLA